MIVKNSKLILTAPFRDHVQIRHLDYKLKEQSSLDIPYQTLINLSRSLFDSIWSLDIYTILESLTNLAKDIFLGSKSFQVVQSSETTSPFSHLVARIATAYSWVTLILVSENTSSSMSVSSHEQLYINLVRSLEYGLNPFAIVNR